MKIIVEIRKDKLKLLNLKEATHATVGRFTARRDTPHFNGDEYHGHCSLSGGREVSWTIRGERKHPNKFPADDKIPSDAKAAVAKVLNLKPSLLEAFTAVDEIEGQTTILQERKKRYQTLLKHNK